MIICRCLILVLLLDFVWGYLSKQSNPNDIENTKKRYGRDVNAPMIKQKIYERKMPTKAKILSKSEKFKYGWKYTFD